MHILCTYGYSVEKLGKYCVYVATVVTRPNTDNVGLIANHNVNVKLCYSAFEMKPCHHILNCH